MVMIMITENSRKKKERFDLHVLAMFLGLNSTALSGKEAVSKII